MYIILVYDINRKRVSKINKICKKYLFPVQKSVFEGNLTLDKLKKLQYELERQIDTDYDSICIYTTERYQNLLKYQIGVCLENSNII